MKTLLLTICVFFAISCKDDSQKKSISEIAKDHSPPPPPLRDTAFERMEAEKAKANAAKVDSLKKLFTFKKDEFKGITWVHPKAKPSYRNANGIYCYFAQDETPLNFRLVIQYLSDDWLFIENVRFVIDGEPYTYTPSNVERDNADGDIWEWCDEPITSSEVSLIMALASAKTAKMRLEGRQYYKEKI